MQHIDVEHLKNETDIVSLIGLWIDLHKFGDTYKGLCPMHKESNPSFTVYPEGHFHCYGCNWHGDAITFVRQMLSLDFMGAVLWLNDRTDSLPMKEGIYASTQVMPTTPIPMSALVYWHSMVKDSVREYYYSRKLSDAIIDYYMLGWDGQNYVIPLWEGIPRDSLVYGVKFRNTKRSPKYFGLKGRSQPRLFNKFVLDDTKEAIVVLGEFDAILGYQWGLATVSPTCGQNTWLAEWTELFEGIDDVFVVPDVGERAAGYRISNALGSSARLCNFPEHTKDLTEFAQMGYSARDFRNLVLERDVKPNSFPIYKFWEDKNNVVVSTNFTRI